MREEVVILMAEDNDGHFALVKRNLVRAGICNEIIQFRDGKEILEFLFSGAEISSRKFVAGLPYILILDIRMPKVDGVEVLRRIKKNKELCKMPVAMLTTTDEPEEIDRCHDLGCNVYLSKPIEYSKFTNAIRKMGLFLSIIQVPEIVE